MTAPPASRGIPRPVTEAAGWRDRVAAFPWAVLARTIEFTATVAHRIPLPVRRVAPSLGRGAPVILVANHRSLLDTPFLRWSFPREVRRRLLFVGGYDFFEPSGHGLKRLVAEGVLRFIVHGYRVWMIDRRHGGPAHVSALAGFMERGWSVLLYPEGRRSRNGRMGSMQSGAAILSMRTGAPVIPLYISGTERVLPAGRGWPRHGTIRIRAGDALRPVEGEHADEFMQRIRAAIVRLSEGEEPGAPLALARAREHAA